jgi:hypothetical protein
MSILQSRRQFLATAALDGLSTLVPAYAQDGVAEINRPLNGVPVNGSVTVTFDADDPDRWPPHCHNLPHRATGMMTEVVRDRVA